MKTFLLWIVCWFGINFPSFAQIPDTNLNNLVLPSGYPTAEWGSIHWQKIGKGKRSVIFLPGWGFDEQSFRPFFEKYFPDYSVYLLSLPGYGNTSAYPMPVEAQSYADGYWIKGVETAILHLLESEKLKKPAFIAHFYVSSHIALQMAAEHPGLFSKIALIGSPARLYFPPPRDKYSLEERIQGVDEVLAPKWFKTVTQETWRKGNFIPATYSLDSMKAQQRFEEANSAPLPVQIRYLCELWSADFQIYEKVKTPVMAYLPSFTPALLADEKLQYLQWHTSAWAPLTAKSGAIHAQTIAGSACNIMDDQPEALSRSLRAFLFH